MLVVTIERDIYSTWGVFGRLSVKGFECWTVERPWTTPGNLPNLSCIPIDTYTMKRAIHYSGDGPGGKPDYRCYEVQDVPNRTYIHIHIANFARHVKGCIGLGGTPLWFDKDRTIGVPGSAATFKRFMETMDGAEKAILVIKNTSHGILDK